MQYKSNCQEISTIKILTALIYVSCLKNKIVTMDILLSPTTLITTETVIHTCCYAEQILHVFITLVVIITKQVMENVLKIY